MVEQSRAKAPARVFTAEVRIIKTGKTMRVRPRFAQALVATGIARYIDDNAVPGTYLTK